MASVEIALVCGLKVRVGCQDRLPVCVNSDADETKADMWGKCYLTTVKKKRKKTTLCFKSAT